MQCIYTARPVELPETSSRIMTQLFLHLIRGDPMTAHVRFKGGITKTLTVPAPLNALQSD
jgi:hypothetical protein